MFFFPFRTDRRLQHVPYVNIALIVLNTLIYLLTSDAAHGLAFTRFFTLNPVRPALYQFVSYQFLHASAMHLGGNMLFLWVFGNSVEDRLGKIGYLAFYLGGGVMAGLGYVLLEKTPVLGASGAIAAVTGAYLAMFPMTNISIFYWFFIYPGVFEVSSMLLILFQIAENLISQIMGNGQVAYLAHLSGYTYGFFVGMGLLASGLLPHEPYDLYSMYSHYRRRSEFRRLTRSGYRPWEVDRNAAPPSAMISPALNLTPAQEQIFSLRPRINQALSAHNPALAAELYIQLLDIDPAQVMDRQQQLDLANQLLAMGRQETAAQAYELFLNTFRTDPQRQEIELLLGLLYTRYLNRRQRARELLSAAVPRLHNPEQRTLAQQLLAEILA